MIHCANCTTLGYCADWGECRLAVPLVERAVPRGPVQIDVDVYEPEDATVSVDPVKPPAPANEPKGPMSTIQETTVRTRWQLIALAAINAVLAAIGLTGADAGPVLDALVLGDWGNAIVALLLLIGAGFAGRITRAVKGT